MSKKSGFSIAFYIIGTIILITLSVFIVINFKNDARILDNLSKKEAVSSTYFDHGEDADKTLLQQFCT